MGALAKWIGELIAPTIREVVMSCLKEYFHDSAEIAKPNTALESIAHKLRNQNNRSASGNDGSKHD